MRNNRIRLTPYQAVTGIRKDFEPYAFKEWYMKNNEVRYNLYLEPGTYTVQAEYAAYDTGELYFNINNDTDTAYYSKIEGVWTDGIRYDVSPYSTENFPGVEIKIQESGVYPLVITRNAEIPDHFNIINVRNFTLNRSQETSHAVIQHLSSLYPNPVRNGYFYCPVAPGENILIYDVAGRLLKSCMVGDDRIIDVSDLRPGIYWAMGTGFKNKLIIAEMH
jgi:hypothetical protein